MKYLSLFSGIGGFELGIQQAYEDKEIGRNTNYCEQESSQNTKGDKPIYERQEKSNDTTNNRPIADTKNADRTLFSDRQQQGDTKSDYMEEIKEDFKVRQQIRQSSDGLLSERSKIRDKQEVLQRQRYKPNAGSECEQPTCIGYSEIDKYAIQVYNKHFNHKNYGNITKIQPENLPDFELVVGGFPCQSFSIAGKRGGFSDTRGTLFFEIARIIKQKQPRLLLLENVKGLLSHDKGKTFTTIISTLDELGYDCQWQVLNSKNFGVPQNRERVFIVGHLRGTSRPEVFPLGGTNEKTIEKIANKSQCNSIFKDTGVSPTISSGTHGYSNGCVKQLNKPKHSNNRIYSDKGLSPTINTMQGGGRQPYINRTVRTGGRGSLTKKHNWDTHMIDGKIRRLTPKESERLQGFPDDWTRWGLDSTGDIVDISDTQRYKMCGNAVTVNVVKEIMLKLIR